MASRVTALVLVGILLVAGGCTGTDSSSPTTTLEQTDTQTPTSTQPQTSAQTSSGSETPSANRTEAGISVTRDRNSGSVLVSVRANTSLESTDPEGENPGEPYFVVEVSGERVHETPEVNRSPSGNYTFTFDSTNLRRSDSETVSVTVLLVDRDSVFDDEIRSWSTSVDAVTDSTTSSSSGGGAVGSTTSSQRGETTGTTATTSEVSSTTTVTTRTTTTTATTQTDASESSSRQSSYTVTVAEIVDGDTARIEYQNGSTETVRLLGVDTPEVHTDNDPAEFENVPNTEAGESCLRDWGHKASEFARSELRGEQVTVTFDRNEGRRGSFDRLLVYVHHDEELFNYRLVAQGYARMYDSDFTERSRFSSAESTAQRESIGLWDCTDAQSATPEPTTTTESPSDGEGSLSIAQIHEDASGNDHENLNEEYVVFENTGDGTLDLSGWSLEDEVEHTYYFPDGITLDPGETVTVYTGSGSDTDSEIYWGSGRAVWNNGGDTIIVKNANGEVVIREEYSG